MDKKQFSSVFLIRKYKIFCSIEDAYKIAERLGEKYFLDFDRNIKYIKNSKNWSAISLH